METIIKFDLQEEEQKIKQLMEEHGLHNWKIGWSKSKRILGRCSYNTKTLIFSKPYWILATAEEKKDTILHEISHALTPGEGHGYIWKRVCQKIGGVPKRLVVTKTKIPGNYKGVCNVCNEVFYMYKKTARHYECSVCKDKKSKFKFKKV